MLVHVGVDQKGKKQYASKTFRGSKRQAERALAEFVTEVAGGGARSEWLVEKRLSIDAPPARVYALLTDAALLVEWMAPVADVDPRLGGALTWTHVNGYSVAGVFVELLVDRPIVFTYGWDRDDVGIPPGSTTVEIDLLPRDVGTELHLVHRGLAGPMADAHLGGWGSYLARLAAVAEGRDPGADPLAGERVPSAREMGTK